MLKLTIELCALAYCLEAKCLKPGWEESELPNFASRDFDGGRSLLAGVGH